MSTYSFLKNLQNLVEDKPDFQARTKTSLTWYKNKVKEIYGNRGVKPTTLFGPSTQKVLPRAGDIILFHYKPKHKDILPYYDIYPLVLILKVVSGGFLGLNFHYLSPRDRLFFMAQLYNYQKYTKSNKRTAINIKYSTLSNSKKLMYYKPCIKKYLIPNINNMSYQISPDEWDAVLFLPTEKFIKEKKEEVWKQSAQKSKG